MCKQPVKWEHEYLDLACRLELFRYRYLPVGRVTDLLNGYIEVVEGLLYAQVHGGLDEVYEDFPDPPNRTGHEIDEPEGSSETS